MIHSLTSKGAHSDMLNVVLLSSIPPLCLCSLMENYSTQVLLSEHTFDTLKGSKMHPTLQNIRGMWEWTKPPSLNREHFPASCSQDRLPWSQKEAKMFLAIISLQSFFSSRRKTQIKEQLSRLHGVKNLNGLSACVTDHQTVLRGLVLQPLTYHVKQLLLETAGILSRKAAGYSEKRSAKYHP